MAKVADLLPGDFVTNGPMSAVFITRCPHPTYAVLYLVVWRIVTNAVWICEPVLWSFDALSPIQHVGDVTPATGDERMERLRAALEGDINQLMVDQIAPKGHGDGV